MKPEELFTKAAALLQEDATAEEESCMVGDRKWACPDCRKESDGRCQAMRNVHERRKVSAALLMMARPSK